MQNCVNKKYMTGHDYIIPDLFNFFFNPLTITMVKGKELANL